MAATLHLSVQHPLDQALTAYAEVYASLLSGGRSWSTAQLPVPTCCTDCLICCMPRFKACYRIKPLLCACLAYQSKNAATASGSAMNVEISMGPKFVVEPEMPR